VIEVLGSIGMLAFLISSAAIGVRLLLLGRRSRQLPEFALGSGFVIGGVVGYAPETVILSTDLLAPGAEANVLLVTQVAIRLAAIGAMVFTWQVFRKESAWAKVFAGLLLGALVLSWVMFPQTRVLAATSQDVFWYDVFTVARSLCIGWGGSGECRLGPARVVGGNDRSHHSLADVLPHPGVQEALRRRGRGKRLRSLRLSSSSRGHCLRRDCGDSRSTRTRRVR
jgi:hypothetical protein